MSQLPNQLLKTTNIPLMGLMDQNINHINQVPIPQLIQNQQNLQLKNNIQNVAPIKVPGQQPQNNNQESN